MSGMTNYDAAAESYSRWRRPDPRIYDAIRNAIGDARTVVNVGAGTGSYEPLDLPVVPVEPSREMGLRHRSPERVINASAESLPFTDSSFDVSLAILTMHHWSDFARGLREMARVAAKRVVLVTWDPNGPEFWLTRDYFPEIREVDDVIFPSFDQLNDVLPISQIEPMMIPHDCVDGFLGAYWRRPEFYLDPDSRAAISSFEKIERLEAGVQKLEQDLESRAWHKSNQELLSLTELDIGYRILLFEVG